jgi:hypothetical protein
MVTVARIQGRARGMSLGHHWCAACRQITGCSFPLDGVRDADVRVFDANVWAALKADGLLPNGLTGADLEAVEAHARRSGDLYGAGLRALAEARRRTEARGKLLPGSIC